MEENELNEEKRSLSYAYENYENEEDEIFKDYFFLDEEN